MELDAQLVLSLGVTDRIPLDEWLPVTVRLIARLLSEFGEAPDKLAELGDPALFFPRDDPRSEVERGEVDERVDDEENEGP